MIHDAESLGNPTAYIFSHLQSTAADIGMLWYHDYQSRRQNNFWLFLDQQFRDNLREEKVRSQLLNMKQKRMGLPVFTVKFMRLAHDAGESQNLGVLRNRYLSALCSDLQEQMVTVIIDLK